MKAASATMANKSLKPTANAWHVPCNPPTKNTGLNSNAKCAPRYGGLVPPLGSHSKRRGK